MNPEVYETFGKNSTWWKKRTPMERRLILFMLIISLIVLALFITLTLVTHNIIQSNNDPVCTSPSCIHAASSVLKNMDPSQDPCDDFYQFACGNYLKQTLIPEGNGKVTPFMSLYNVLQDQLKVMFEEPLPPTAPKPYQLMQEMYNVCMNITAIEEDGLTTIKAFLEELGGWPVLEGSNWNENAFEWKEFVYKTQNTDFDRAYFMKLFIGPDYNDPNRYTINIDQARLGMNREILVKGPTEKEVEAYYDYMVDVSVLFGANRSTALKELNATLDFEIKLANISRPLEERRNLSALYNPMTIKELQENYPYLPWLEYINNVLGIQEFDITEDEEVIVAEPEFLNNLGELLQETPKRVQANYVMTSLVLAAARFLTKELLDRQHQYGISGEDPRWMKCIVVGRIGLSLATSALYVTKHFKGESKKHAEEIAANIQEQFLKTLEEVEWMDEVTREQALEKFALMSVHLGYPDELLDEDLIDNFYSTLEIDSSNFLRAMNGFATFSRKKMAQKFREPVKKSKWVYYAQLTTFTTIYYLEDENTIEFPAGALQGVFFNDLRPNYMNYGGIGNIIGNKIVEGFGERGSQFDKHGKLNNWWTENTKKAFSEKAQCIIEQYGNYTVPEIELNLNGTNTQNQNVADNGGIRQAYLAYQAWVERNDPEPRLPGLHYTPNQMFWISAANGLNQSPNKFRVLGSFSNSEYFSKDFNCPLGSPMNPINKCRVW